MSWLFLSLAFFGGVLPLLAVGMAMCACLKRKERYVPMTSSHHEENLRLPLSKNASPVCGDLPEGRVSTSPYHASSYQASPKVSPPCLRYT